MIVLSCYPALGILVCWPISWISWRILNFLPRFWHSSCQEIQSFSWILFHDLEKCCKIWHVLPRIIANIFARNCRKLRDFLLRKPSLQALGWMAPGPLNKDGFEDHQSVCRGFVEKKGSFISHFSFKDLISFRRHRKRWSGGSSEHICEACGQRIPQEKTFSDLQGSKSTVSLKQ